MPQEISPVQSNPYKVDDDRESEQEIKCAASPVNNGLDQEGYTEETLFLLMKVTPVVVQPM